METCQTLPALRAATARLRAAGRRIAIVPTMGALHAGHIALVAAARPLLAAALPGAQPSVVQGEPAEGNAPGAPYDIILIDGAVEEIPPALIAQLAEGGRLVTVLNEPGKAPRAVLGQKTGTAFHTQRLFDAHAPALPGLQKLPAFAL